MWVFHVPCKLTIECRRFMMGLKDHWEYMGRNPHAGNKHGNPSGSKYECTRNDTETPAEFIRGPSLLTDLLELVIQKAFLSWQHASPKRPPPAITSDSPANNFAIGWKPPQESKKTQFWAARLYQPRDHHRARAGRHNSWPEMVGLLIEGVLLQRSCPHCQS